MSSFLFALLCCVRMTLDTSQYFYTSPLYCTAMEKIVG